MVVLKLVGRREPAINGALLAVPNITLIIASEI